MKVYQHLSCTSPFHVVEKLSEHAEQSRPGLFTCKIEFNICHKQAGSPTTIRTQHKVEGRYHRKKEATKVAWNKVIQQTYQKLSNLPQEPILTN